MQTEAFRLKARNGAEALQPNRDPAGKVNPILGVADPAVEQDMLGRLVALNQQMTGKDPHSIVG